MGISFIFFIFGLTVSAKEEDLQGFQSLQTESATFIITMPSEEQNSSSDNGGKVSTESPPRLTVAVISSPGTDLFHTPHERQHSSTVNATTTSDKDAITSNGESFVLAYGTGSHSTSKDSTAAKPFQSEGDYSLISNDEGRLHPSAKAEFESMMNDTMMPAAHLSGGREKISAFLHASLESKNQRVLESITPSPANDIPMVSASDPAVIDNHGESNDSVERLGENKNENWTLESFRAENPLNRTEEASLTKNQSTIMHFTVLQGLGLLTTELSQNPKNGSGHEPKEQKNLLSPSSLILDTPLQVKSPSQVILNKMTESSKNPSTNGPKPFGVSLKNPDSMFLFSASKLTPTMIPDATRLNYFSNMVTAAGEMHVTKQFVASRLISDSMHRIVSARDGLESKSIFYTKSSKERQIKPTLQTSANSFVHRLSKSDLSLVAQNSSLLKTSDLCTKEARTSNISVTEKHNKMDHFPVRLSELIDFSTASFTNAEEATIANKQMFMKQTQSSLAAFRTLLPQEDTSKNHDQFDELSTALPLPPLTKLENVFHVFKVNDHQPQKPLNHFPSERLKPFVSAQTHESIPLSFTSATVKRFTNMENLTKFDSTNQNQQYGVSQKVSYIISKRPNVNSSRLTGHETANTTTINESMSHFRVPLTNSNIPTTKTFITTTMFLKPWVSFANISLFARAILQKKSFLLPTPFGKSQNTVTTDSKVFSKSNSEYAFLNHSLTTKKIGLPLEDKQQDLKNPRGTVMLFFGSYTVSSIPSVQRLIEAHPGEVFLTEAPQTQSVLQIESYLKKRDDMVKPTTLKHHGQNSSSVVGMNQTLLMPIPRKIVLHPIHTSVSPVVHLNTEFKRHLTPSASPSVSIWPAITQKSGQDNHKNSLSSYHMFVNLSDVKEHPQNMTSSQISGISRHTTAVAQPEGALNTSLLESSNGTTFPLFLFQMQNVLHKEHLTLTEDHTDFFSTVNQHSQTTQSDFPADEMSSLGATDEIQKHLGRTALSAVTGEKFSPLVHADLSFSSTEKQLLPNGSLPSRGGSEDISHAITPFAESDYGRSTEFVSDLPVINRKRRVTSSDSLSGLAQISDDICGTGNYTAEMSLNLERDIMPGDLIPALGNLRVVISLKTNNSQVNLEIKSCCLSPTGRLDEFNTTCCIFSRLPIEPHGIRLLPSVLSKRASFTISLFQMINYSTAYLHCDLSVCLRNHSECERQCLQHRNAHLREESRAIFSSTGNRISFGPVLKGADNSSASETADDTEAMVVIISSVACCLLACLALLLVWIGNRRCLQRSAYCWSRGLCEC
ncbi:uncharacterized protein LOC125249045 isoform X1 [Megalobrama amblycephala]|uniref:uncharacterized protein LOC125249045 isoform X1 n=1 Tax=Megalobrama amblycephala TaxID=75352 RepID=UPI002013C439|nr:uncharacterized protein LOC125249045 isoform X1 [Megalobrama amblycephala]